jgi:hypothetical protein
MFYPKMMSGQMPTQVSLAPAAGIAAGVRSAECKAFGL